MLGYFTCTRNRVPSAHMQSLYLSIPSSKYTSPAELGIRVALNITDPLRMMLFSCKEKKTEAIHAHIFISISFKLYSCKSLKNLYLKRQNSGRFCTKVGKQALLNPSVTHQVVLRGQVVIFHTYSPELNASTHFELYSSAHYVDTLVSTNDGLAVPFNVQVRCCTTGDLKSQTRDLSTLQTANKEVYKGFRLRLTFAPVL